MATKRNSTPEHVETVFLVIKSDMNVRVAKKPRLNQDEVAIRVNLIFPRSWATVIGTMDVSVPDNTPMFTWSGEPAADPAQD